MNELLFHQNRFTRTSLSAARSNFVEEKFIFLHYQDSPVSMNPVTHCPTLQNMSRDMRFPTMWHFVKNRLRGVCAASF